LPLVTRSTVAIFDLDSLSCIATSSIFLSRAKIRLGFRTLAAAPAHVTRFCFYQEANAIRFASSVGG